MTATSPGALDPLLEPWGELWTLPALRANSIHIWRLLPTARLAPEDYTPFLQPEERERAGRLRFPADQWQSLASRATLRLLLAHYAGHAHALHLRLALTDRGKPTLPGSSIRFNLSHTRDVAVFAFARDMEVGVDVERTHAISDLDDVAEQNFAAAELAALRSLPEAERTLAFYRCWTRKEALLKAEGSGLFRSLDSFTVSLRPSEPAALLHADWSAAWTPQEGPRWELAHLGVARDAIGAVAWRRRQPRPERMLFDWSASLLV